jgi:hypothetical protein
MMGEVQKPSICKWTTSLSIHLSLTNLSQCPLNRRLCGFQSCYGNGDEKYCSDSNIGNFLSRDKSGKVYYNL